MSTGGAERVCSHLVNHWAERGWDITVVTLFGTDRDSYALHPSIRRVAFDLGHESGNLLKAFGNSWMRLRALIRVLRDVRPDIALSFMDRSNVLLALAAEFCVSIGSERSHPPQEPRHWIWDKLRRRLYSRLDAVVSLTEMSASWLREHTNARRVLVIPNPVVWPMPIHAPVIEPPVKKKLRLLAVGRLVPLKQFDLLIEVFSQIASGCPQWELQIIGDGPEMGRLRAIVAATSCADRIHLPGQIGNLGDWYGSADLYVMTSKYEGFPNAVIEALAHGIPAICFDCDTGPRDIIRPDVDGMLVPSGCRTGLVAALVAVMSNSDLRSRLAARAEEARERFSIGLISSKWESLFREILAERQGS